MTNNDSYNFFIYAYWRGEQLILILFNDYLDIAKHETILPE